jgi:hypothetical protein
MPERLRLLQCLYFVLAAMLSVVTITAYAVGTVTITAPEGGLFGGGALVLLAYGAAMLAAATERWTRVIGHFCMAVGAWLLPLLLTLTASIALTPFGWRAADSWLAWPEELIGLTQTDVAAWCAAWGLLPYLAAVYASIAVQGRAACVYWGLVRQDTTVLWEVSTGFLLCTFACLPIYLVAPALGPWAYYAQEGPMPPWLIEWVAMRTGPHTINQYDGFIAAPSYHAVFAVMLTRAWWDSPLRSGVVIVNAVMLLAAWVVGQHYLTDLVLGTLIAGAALAVVRGATAARTPARVASC